VLLRDTREGEGVIFGIFLGDFSYRLVGGIISPCMNGIYAWIAIDDDALRRLTIDGMTGVPLPAAPPAATTCPPCCLMISRAFGRYSFAYPSGLVTSISPIK